MESSGGSWYRFYRHNKASFLVQYDGTWKVNILTMSEELKLLKTFHLLLHYIIRLIHYQRG